MRKGWKPQMLFTKKGNLVALWTGADATTEHEIGIKPLMSLLSTGNTEADALVAELKNGFTPKYPDIVESRRITKVPEELKFQEIPPRLATDEPQAILSVCRVDPSRFKNELNFPHVNDRGEDSNLATAWDDRSFAIRVRGVKHVKTLKALYQAILDKHIVFGGSFLKRADAYPSGIVLVDTRYLSEEDKAAIKAAQHAFESKLRLRARDDSAELSNEMHKHLGPNQHFGFLWAQWADAQESAVVYSLNPGYNVKADYGSYTREELLRWAKAGCSYQLRHKSAA